MKKEIVLWLLIVALLAASLLPCTRQGNMAIDFTNAASQRIDFGDVAAIDLAQKTIVVWIDFDSFGDTSVHGYLLSKWYWVFYIGTTTERLVFMQTWSSGGIWATANNSVTTGKHMLAVTYDRGSDTNDPIFYIDGSPSATTELVAPSGSVTSDAGQNLVLGAPGTTKSIDGRELDVRIYNRILTAAEIAQIYSARGADNIRNGLVFCPFLKGAKGLQVFDGATLAAGNTLIDPCSGATGTPGGDPVGMGETFLSVKP